MFISPIALKKNKIDEENRNKAIAEDLIHNYHICPLCGSDLLHCNPITLSFTDYTDSLYCPLHKFDLYGVEAEECR